MASGNEIFARARTLATQMGGDANQSTAIDALGGLRAALNHSIREVYRRKANDQKFLRDITVRHTVTVVASVGDVPDEVMREFLHQAELQDDDSSLISYMAYAVDADSGVTFDQLGYVWVVGDEFNYTAPTGSYDGNLFVTAPSFPEFPASMATNIPMTVATTDDVIVTLSEMIVGKIEVVSV